MPSIDIFLLGGFQFLYNNNPIKQLQTPLFSRLIAYLVMHDDIPQSRHRIAFLFWPDLPEEKAKRNLRQLLYRLFNILPEAESFIDVRRKTLQWQPKSAYTLDVAAFKTAYEQADSADEWRHAVGLYSGDLLPGIYDDWVLRRRQQLHQQYIDGLRQLIQLLEKQGELGEAIMYAERLVNVNPLHEANYALLMRLHMANDERSAALDIYHSYGNHPDTIEPSERLDALKDRLVHRRQLASHTLPSQPTPFIGRQEELQAVLERLQKPTCRLLTIGGIGGIGKTRLALAAGEQLRRYFDDGVFFIPLQDHMLAQSLIRTLDVPTEGKRPMHEQIIDYLRHRAILLILDSFEHVEDDSLILSMLEAAPDLRLLVTSRRYLDLRWEWRFPLDGLSVPETIEEPEDLTQYEASQLFLEMARRAVPQRRLTLQDAQAVVRICQLVQGMPLALETAAAWVRELSYQEIAARIETDLTFLQTPLRDVPQRQRSMMVILDKSLERLSEHLRHCFTQLVYLPGSFTVEAALAITDASQRDLDTLVEFSLVKQNGRYDIHNLLREYVKKTQSVPGHIREKHAYYYLNWLAELEQNVLGDANQQEVLDQINTEMIHLRAAWEWASEHKQTALLTVATFPLAQFLLTQHRYEQGAQLFSKHVLPIIEAFHASFLNYLGQYEMAEARAVNVLDYSEASTTACYVISRNAWVRGNYRRAADFAQRGLAASTEREEWLRRGQFHRLLGLIAIGEFAQRHHDGQYIDLVYQAQEHYRQALEIHERIGYRLGQAKALHNLGHSYLPLYLVTNDPDKRQRYTDQMIAYFQKAVEVERTLPFSSSLAQTLNWLAYVHARCQDDRDQAKIHLQEALVVMHDIQEPTIIGDLLSTIAEHIYLPEGQLTDAVELATLILEHPATDVRIRDRCEKVLARVALPTAVFAAAQMRSHQLTFSDAAQSALEYLGNSEKRVLDQA